MMLTDLVSVKTIDTLPLDPKMAIGQHIAVLGMTGSGKTNTCYVWSEAELAAGQLLTIVDPEGDYHYLKQQFDLLIIGKPRRGNPCDLEVVPENGAKLADILVRRGISVLLDLSGLRLDQRNTFVLNYVGRLWELYQDEDLPPHRLLIDEVQLFAPQGPMTDSKMLIQDMALRARKRRLGLLVASQRFQTVDKTVLDATSVRLLHRQPRGRALVAYRDLLPGSLPRAAEFVPGLDRGQAIFMVNDDAQVIQVPASATFRAESAANIVTDQRPIDGALLAELRTLIHGKSDSVVVPALDSQPVLVEQLKDEISRLREINTTLHLENQKLKQELSAARSAQSTETEPAEQLELIKDTAAAGSDESEERSPRALARAYTRQERLFNALLEHIRRQPPFQRDMLRFLLDQEGKWYTASEVARYAGFSKSTLFNQPPMLLLKLTLLARRKAQKNFEYMATARVTFEREYPDLNTEVLIGRLLKACQ